MILEHQEQNLICWFPGEKLSREAVIEYFLHLKKCPWGQQADRFCDFSELRDYTFNYRGLFELAEFRQQTLNEHQHVRLVMYSNYPLGYGMARMYQHTMDQWPIDILVTQDLEEACRYLGLKDCTVLQQKS